MSFWKTGVLLGVIHGAVCFFVPYYSLATSGSHNVTDVYSLGVWAGPSDAAWLGRAVPAVHMQGEGRGGAGLLCCGQD